MKLAADLFIAFTVIVAIGVVPCCSSAIAQESPAALDFEMKSIDGTDISLSKYAGKVVVFVNVASKCGYTKQYQQLQELHENYADQGLAIVGIPSNQFGRQEPGSEEEILAFCQKNYGVEFDLMSKVDVNGENQTDLYKYLTSLDLAPKGKGPVKWNFEKFVVDKTGTPIARFASRVSPDSDEFASAIKQALGSETGTPLSQVSQKNGKTYYLFSKKVPLKNSDKVSTIYYFSKHPNNAKGEPVLELPEGKVISEGKNGVPILKNKQ